MAAKPRPRVASAWAAIVLMLTACGAPNSAPLAAASELSASPASLSNTTPAQVVVSGLRGPANVTVADRQIVDVSTPLANGATISFTVTAVAGGSTSITVADSTGASLSIPVSFLACLPPVPIVTFLGIGVTNAGTPTLFFSSPGSAQTSGLIASYRARLIGSDGTVVQGSALQPIAQAGTITLVPPSADWFATFPGYTRGSTYRVQLVGRGCEPPFIVGSF